MIYPDSASRYAIRNPDKNKLVLSLRRTYLPCFCFKDSYWTSVVRKTAYWPAIPEHYSTIEYKGYAKLIDLFLYVTQTPKKIIRNDVNICVHRGLILSEQGEALVLSTKINTEKHIQEIMSPDLKYRLYMSFSFVDPSGPYKRIYTNLMKKFFCKYSSTILIVNNIEDLFIDKLATESESMEFEDAIEKMNDYGKLIYTEEEE